MRAANAMRRAFVRDMSFLSVGVAPAGWVVRLLDAGEADGVDDPAAEDAVEDHDRDGWR